MDFVASSNQRVKMKERETLNKYLDLAWDLEKLWSMKVLMITFVVGALGTVLKGFEINNNKKQRLKEFEIEDM